jgi:hypothetical protein
VITPAVLAPLGSATLVFNAIFAKVMVKEPFTRTHLIGTLIIIGGAVIIALFGFVPESSMWPAYAPALPHIVERCPYTHSHAYTRRNARLAHGHHRPLLLV